MQTIKSRDVLLLHKDLKLAHCKPQLLLKALKPIGCPIVVVGWAFLPGISTLQRHDHYNLDARTTGSHQPPLLIINVLK